MDLQDFQSDTLYFYEDKNIVVDSFIAEAASKYAQGQAEEPLLKAYTMAPSSLTVLVALYRFYFYQHRYLDALSTAYHLLDVLAPRIDFPAHWHAVDERALYKGVMKSISLVRFYLLVLKAAGYVSLRLDLFQQGQQMLSKVVSLDSDDRLGAKSLLELVNRHCSQRKLYIVTESSMAHSS
jgi:DNA-binding transcriptional ArsR family regulator